MLYNRLIATGRRRSRRAQNSVCYVFQSHPVCDYIPPMNRRQCDSENKKYRDDCDAWEAVIGFQYAFRVSLYFSPRTYLCHDRSCAVEIILTQMFTSSWRCITFPSPSTDFVTERLCPQYNESCTCLWHSSHVIVFTDCVEYWELIDWEDSTPFPFRIGHWCSYARKRFAMDEKWYLKKHCVF